MALESIRVLKAENIPIETRVKHNLPDTGFIEIRTERNSDPEPSFHKLDSARVLELREKLKGKNMLFKK